MKQVKKPKAPKKSTSTKYKKRQKRERGNREVKQSARIRAEVEFSERNFAQRDAPLVCPLCNQPITEEDQKYNIHRVTTDHKSVQVHRTCPGESEE